MKDAFFILLYCEEVGYTTRQGNYSANFLKIRGIAAPKPKVDLYSLGFRSLNAQKIVSVYSFVKSFL
jgi:hypothetical protein